MSYNVELELEDWHQQILGHRKAYKFICMWMAKTMQNLACKQCGIVINTLINRKAVQSCLHWGNKLWSRRLDAKAALLYLEPAGTCTAPYLKGLIHIATMSSNLVIKRASWTVAARPSQRWLQSRCAPKMVKGDLSLLRRKNKGSWVGRGGKRGSAAGQLLGTAGPGEVLPGGGEKARSKHLDSSLPPATPMKSQAAEADAWAGQSFALPGRFCGKALPAAQQVLWNTHLHSSSDKPVSGWVRA